jgi:hypothetical protein
MPQPQRGLLRLATGKPCRFRAGRDYTTGGNRVHVTTVDHLALGDITHDQAKALGHKGTAAFKRAWVADHDAGWLGPVDRSEADILQRFATRWAHRGAWFVRYQAAEEPRFMAEQRGRAHGDGQYTPSPARSIDPDAECVDEATQDRYAKDALGFCIGRQLNRAKEQAAKRDARARQFRDAA